MANRIRLAAAVVCFLLFPLTEAYSQSLEVLTPKTKPGGLVVLKIDSYLMGEEIEVNVFDTIYKPNKDGLVFVGVPIGTYPGLYLASYFVNRFSEKIIGWGSREIQVVPAEIKVRLTHGIARPSKRRTREASAIAVAYQKANHAEFYAKDSFRTPLPEILITSDFAIHHSGVDLQASSGTKVLAINSGRVIMTAKKFSLEGNMVILDHGSRIFSYYMHLSRIQVRDGQVINKGQAVGLSGATGDARGPHLHLSVKVNGENIDPLAFIETINSVFKDW